MKNLPFDASTMLVKVPASSQEKITWSIEDYSSDQAYSQYYVIDQDGVFTTAEGEVEPPYPVYIVATSESGLQAKLKFWGQWAL